VWYIDEVLDMPREEEVARYEIWRPEWPSVEGQVSDDITSNLAVWKIFIDAGAGIAMKMSGTPSCW
jgi:hypothetical protein